jgi:FlaA1/EpsC-like NDP-sugar epimerase
MGAFVSQFGRTAKAAASERVRVGIVGAGGRAASLIASFSANQWVEVVGIADLDSNRLPMGLESAAKLQGIRPRGEGDFRKLIDDPSIDALVVGTPDHWHAKMLVDACRAGKASLVHLGANSLGDVSHSVSPFHRFSSDDVNRDMAVRDLLLRGDSIIDPNARMDAYTKALALIHDRAYVLPLYTQTTFYVAAKDLVFRAHADNILRFWEMTYR